MTHIDLHGIFEFFRQFQASGYIIFFPLNNIVYVLRERTRTCSLKIGLRCRSLNFWIPRHVGVLETFIQIDNIDVSKSVIDLPQARAASEQQNDPHFTEFDIQSEMNEHFMQCIFCNMITSQSTIKTKVAIRRRCSFVWVYNFTMFR